MPGPDPPTVVVVASLPVDSHIWIPGLACPTLALYRQVQRFTLNANNSKQNGFLIGLLVSPYLLSNA